MTIKATARSEYAAWVQVAGACAAALRKLPANYMATADIKSAAEKIRQIETLALEMVNQVADGVHKNPPLTIFALNPPAKIPSAAIMSRRVIGVEYVHAGDRQKYRHDCAVGVEMIADPSGAIILRRPDGREVWREF